MTFKIRRIAVRFALLLTLVAIVPLVAYGVVSILSLQRGTRESVIAGNENVATRAAEEIRRYIVTHADLLRALSADLQDTGLNPRQQDQILKNFVLQFREFRELTLFDESGATIATSRVGKPRIAIPKNGRPVTDRVTMSPIQVDADLLPTSVFAVRLMRLNQPSGWLAGEFNLEDMWRMVDHIRIGANGYALVVAPGGELIAHGDPDKKALVALAHNMSGHPLVQKVNARHLTSPVWGEYSGEDGRSSLAVAAPIATLGWTVIVEQPTSEAYATAIRLQRQLVVAILVALCLMIAAGYLFGRRMLIRPILALRRATQDIAGGRLDVRVDIRTGDEFSQLGDAFNTMADRLIHLQDDIKRQERHATFGRIAAGLVHDLSHPIQNIGNSLRLLFRDDIEPESRDLFRRTAERELATLKRFMDDLRNVVRPKPLERFAVDMNRLIAEVVEPLRVDAERAGVALELDAAPASLVVDGDRFALGRVYRNLVTNAIQATRSGGRVVVTTRRAGDRAVVHVADNGSGISPERLSTIFDEFMTTKSQGLGLGLAITRRIVEELNGTITVESEVGTGTTFTLQFPARDEGAAEAAAS
jgi:signal transduction histidine kinase